MPEDWGLDRGDLDRLEEEETRKTEFLKAGIENKLAGKAPKQMTIRTWSQTELWCRTLALQVIDLSSVKGRFMSSLKEDLGDRWKVMQPLDLEGMPEEERRARTTGCTTSTILQEELPQHNLVK